MVVVMREFLFSFVCAVLGVSCCGFSVGLQLCLLQCPDQRRSCNAGIKGGRDKFVRPLLFRTRLYSVVALFFFFFYYLLLFFLRVSLFHVGPETTVHVFFPFLQMGGSEMGASWEDATRQLGSRSCFSKRPAGL